MNYLVPVRNRPNLLPKDTKAIIMRFYMLFCMLIMHTRTEHCLFNSNTCVELRSYRLKDLINLTKFLEKVIDVNLYNHFLKKRSKVVRLSWNFSSKYDTLFLKLVYKTINSHEIYLSVSMKVKLRYIFIEKYMYIFLETIDFLYPYPTSKNNLF